MRFNLAAISTTFMGMTLATPTAFPNALKVRADQSAHTDIILSINGTALSPEISWPCIWNCAGVLAESGCLIAAIASGNIEIIPDCIEANGNWNDVCGCINCIPGLSNFVHKHGKCK